MQTSQTSSEEERVLYLRKFAQNMRKVLNCLKILLTNMRLTASFQTSPILPFPSHPRIGLLIPLQETLLQPVLKSFITVFNYNEGLENKLTRAPLLDLVKSIF